MIKRLAFTLIEMMIAIAILSIMILFLYKTNDSVNKSTLFYKKEVNKLTITELEKKTIYLDFLLMLAKSNSIIHQRKNEDMVFMQTKNSIHRRVNPYVAYIVSNHKLYRLESFKKLSYPINPDNEFDIDYMGEVFNFRVYKRQRTPRNIFLVQIDFQKLKRIFLKIESLNEL